MTRFRLMFVSIALLALAGSAGAQRWGGSPSSSSAKGGSSAQVHQAGGGSWNGSVSKWGGSPVQPAGNPRAQLVYVIPMNAYLPAAVAAPAPVPVTYVVDTVYSAAPANPVAMQVVAPSRAKPQLTTMEVYRQQRFGKQP